MLKKVYNKIFSVKENKLFIIIDGFIREVKEKNLLIDKKLLDTLTPLVLDELANGTSWVYIATPSEFSNASSISTAADQLLGILGAGMHEEEKTLCVFSSEKTLLKFYDPDKSQKQCHYVKIPGSHLLELAEVNDFQKIIIDNVLPLGRVL